ncbi:hypothetical protein ACLKA6_012488 [Drosophila palustris]
MESKQFVPPFEAAPRTLELSAILMVPNHRNPHGETTPYGNLLYKILQTPSFPCHSLFVIYIISAIKVWDLGFDLDHICKTPSNCKL